jgi:polar amino acid transport system substrate-binding protein
MKKFLSLALAALLLCGSILGLAACGGNEIIVRTNAYFAPFEYYDGTEIVGVDVDIMNLVGKKLGKEIVWKDGDFGTIIDNVAEGKIADCGAAGITITDARKEKVDFSNPYYTSIQYVVVPAGVTVETKTVDGITYIVWEALAGKKIATQIDTTGWIYTDGEINATEDNDYGYAGVLYGTNTTLVEMPDAQAAVDALNVTADVFVIDQLPAQYLVANSSKSLTAYPLYYSGAEGEADAPVEEQYAICVTKGNTELLDAINAVLAELGEEKIQQMVMEHMGLAD